MNIFIKSLAYKTSYYFFSFFHKTWDLVSSTYNFFFTDVDKLPFVINKIYIIDDSTIIDVTDEYERYIENQENNQDEFEVRKIIYLSDYFSSKINEKKRLHVHYTVNIKTSEGMLEYKNMKSLSKTYIISYKSKNSITFPPYKIEDIEIYHNSHNFKQAVLEADVQKDGIITRQITDIVARWSGPLENFYCDTECANVKHSDILTNKSNNLIIHDSLCDEFIFKYDDIIKWNPKEVKTIDDPYYKTPRSLENSSSCYVISENLSESSDNESENINENMRSIILDKPDIE